MEWFALKGLDCADDAENGVDQPNDGKKRIHSQQEGEKRRVDRVWVRRSALAELRKHVREEQCLEAERHRKGDEGEDEVKPKRLLGL